jgi:hypothetical protein
MNRNTSKKYHRIQASFKQLTKQGMERTSALDHLADQWCISSPQIRKIIKMKLAETPSIADTCQMLLFNLTQNEPPVEAGSSTQR